MHHSIMTFRILLQKNLIYPFIKRVSFYFFQFIMLGFFSKIGNFENFCLNKSYKIVFNNSLSSNDHSVSPLSKLHLFVTGIIISSQKKKLY